MVGVSDVVPLDDENTRALAEFEAKTPTTPLAEGKSDSGEVDCVTVTAECAAPEHPPPQSQRDRAEPELKRVAEDATLLVPKM